MKSGARLRLTGAAMLLTLASCTNGPPASTPLSYAEITGSIEPSPWASDVSLAPIRTTKKHVFLLLGGRQGQNEWVTSSGMFLFRASLAPLPDVEVTPYYCPPSRKAANDNDLLPNDDIVTAV